MLRSIAEVTVFFARSENENNGVGEQLFLWLLSLEIIGHASVC